VGVSLTQTIDPSQEGRVGETGESGEMGKGSKANGWSFCHCATPTAAPAADQTTSLSASLALLSLTLPAPFFLAHTFDTTSTNHL
jgi:hypothetical protein